MREWIERYARKRTRKEWWPAFHDGAAYPDNCVVCGGDLKSRADRNKCDRCAQALMRKNRELQLTRKRKAAAVQRKSDQVDGDADEGEEYPDASECDGEQVDGDADEHDDVISSVEEED